MIIPLLCGMHIQAVSIVVFSDVNSLGVDAAITFHSSLGLIGVRHCKLCIYSMLSLSIHILVGVSTHIKSLNW